MITRPVSHRAVVARIRRQIGERNTFTRATAREISSNSLAEGDYLLIREGGSFDAGSLTYFAEKLGVLATGETIEG